MTVALLVLAIIICMFLGVPLALAILAPSLVYIVLSDVTSISALVSQTVGGIDSFTLLAIPLFVLMGNLLNASTLTDRIFLWVATVLHRVPGALGYTNIATSVVFAGMSGAAVADAAGLGTVQVRAMRAHGYSREFSLGLTAASSTIGPIIPPSLPAVVYASAAGISVGSLFMAGIVPGLLMAVALAVTVFILARKMKPTTDGQTGFKGNVWSESIKIVPLLLTPVVLLGGIFGGFFTATESAAVAIVYVLFIGTVVYRTLTPRRMFTAVIESARTTIAIMIIIGAASSFGFILALNQIPQQIVQVLTDVFGTGPLAVVALIIALLIIGTFLEPLAAIVILGPALGPMAAVLDMHPAQFGVLVILCLMLGLLTPPVGMVLFSLASVTGETVGVVWRGILPFLPSLLSCVLIVAFVPHATTFIISLLQ
jgi:tripartite ATP-independent transporter DctM subunit